jgi:hypothetical protein
MKRSTLAIVLAATATASGDSEFAMLDRQSTRWTDQG